MIRVHVPPCYHTRKQQMYTETSSSATSRKDNPHLAVLEDGILQNGYNNNINNNKCFLYLQDIVYISGVIFTYLYILHVRGPWHRLSPRKQPRYQKGTDDILLPQTQCTRATKEKQIEPQTTLHIWPLTCFHADDDRLWRWSKWDLLAAVPGSPVTSASPAARHATQRSVTSPGLTNWRCSTFTFVLPQPLPPRCQICWTTGAWKCLLTI